MAYVAFSEEEKITANTVDLETFLRMRGERLERVGRETKLIYHDSSGKHDSIMINGSQWYDHKNQTGGGAIKFMQHFYGMTFLQSVQELLGTSISKTPSRSADVSQKKKKPFELPKPNGNMHRVFAYLIKQRYIDSDVITHFAKAGTLYEDAEHHNVVFVGVDENGVPRQASKRSTSTFGKTFRITVEGSDTAYSFAHFGQSNKLFVFEAPIDMLSFITLHKRGWERHSYIAMNGVYESAVMKALEMHENLNRVYLCTDNDVGGIDAAYRLKDILKANGYDDIYRVFPDNKDFNEDLKAKNGAAAIRAEKYIRFDKVMEISDKLDHYRCVPERLLSRLQATAKGEQYEYLAEYALAGSAFFLVKDHSDEAEKTMFDKLRSKLKSEYKPYTDKAFRHTRMSQLNDLLKAVSRELNLRARTREQEIKTAEMLYRLAESVVRLSADISISETESIEQGDSQDEDSYALSSGYG